MTSDGERRGWREQYDRMKRWQTRLHEPGVADEQRRDDFYAFFVSCFHLKDWLKRDPSVPRLVGEKAEELINRPSLRVCADIANGVKHLVRTNMKSVRFDADAQLSITPSAFQADAFDEDAFQTGEIVIEAIGQTWPALEVADGCVRYWDDFLRQEGLLATTD
jgi:hypothetical protein